MGKTKASGFNDYSNEERKKESKLINDNPKQFNDKPVAGEEGGWRYDPRGEEHGEEQKEFFKNNSNFDELISKMSYEEKEAFMSWASGYLMGGQQYKGWDTMDDLYKGWTQAYDKVLDDSVLHKGVILYRLSTAELVLGAGNKMGSLKQLMAMEGQTIISKGNMSCAAASEGLRISPDWGNKNVEYRIHIPSKTKGAGMWIGDHRINHWGTIQREFMTNRDARFKVGKTTQRKDKDGHTIYVVNLTYDGHTEHDYGKSGRISKRLRY